MGNGGREDLYLKLLQNLDDRHDEMHAELIQLRTTVNRVIELGCELTQTKGRLLDIETELKELKDELSGVVRKMILPEKFGAGMKWFFAVVLTALVTLWINATVDFQEQPIPPASQKMEKDVGKKVPGKPNNMGGEPV